MNKENVFPLDGGCACGQTRYRMATEPLFVHCCHCTWCQRESGAAFALNALIETERVQSLSGKPRAVVTPSNSGKGQTILRCPECAVALWSHYAGAGEALCFVRVGTLDQAALVAPDIHIYTSTRHPWVALPPDVPAMDGYYRRSESWPKHSVERLHALRERVAPRANGD